MKFHRPSNGEVDIRLDGRSLPGILHIPEQARGLVLFSHGSGSSRLSPRNNYVAGVLRQHGLGTLLFDLLTEAEDRIYENRFDIGLLTRRLIAVTDWVLLYLGKSKLPIGYFGASTGAASALRAAAHFKDRIAALVSRGGRPDLAKNDLARVQAPTLLLVGSLDTQVIELNQWAGERMQCEWKLELIPGATHLFEEPGTLEQVAEESADWFELHFKNTASYVPG